MNCEELKKTLLLRVDEAGTDICLFIDEKEIDRVRVEPNRELLERTLLAIEGLLLRHALLPKTIELLRVESSLPEGYSARRIAEAVAEIWMFARSR